MDVIYTILSIVGALGLFIFGMKTMSEALQKLAGSRIRNILSAITSNRFKSVLTGLLTTASIQSSSAITVMLVSFANAGLISVYESAGVVMGANIGTTATAWIISLLGLGKQFSIQLYLLPLIALSMPLFFSMRSRLNSWAEFILGLSILFFGLGFLREVIPIVPQESSFIKEMLSYYSTSGVVSLLTFLVFGLLLTALFQSSSATVALTFVLAIEGWIPFSMAAAMVLGENIGTTITALIASSVANRPGKRVAVIHLLFNLMGVIWGLILLKPILLLINAAMTGLSMESPFSDPGAIPVALSIFHSGFNIVNMFILINFIPRLVSLSLTIFPPSESEENYRLTFIDSAILSTSEISLVQSRKEIAIMGKRAQEMFTMIPQLLVEKKPKDYYLLLQRIEKYENIVDNMELEIATYLTRVTQGRLSDRGSMQSRVMLKIIDDIESIADVCYKISKLIDVKNEKRLYFIQELRNNTSKLFNLTAEALENMVSILSKPYSEANCIRARSIDQAIHEMRDTLRQEHLISLKEEQYNYQTGIIYNDILRLTERVGDFAFRVCESIEEIKLSKN